MSLTSELGLEKENTLPPAGVERARERGVSASNATAFEEILVRDREKLYRLAYGMLRNREDAEDALQNAFWNAFRRLPAFEGRSTLSTWITRIVINSALMIIRRRKSHLEYSLDGVIEDQPESLARCVMDCRPGPEQICAAVELLQITESQLLKLSASEQAAFRHFVVYEHSMKESAWALGVPAATVKSRVYRTRRKLARRMQQSPNNACTVALHEGSQP